MDQQEFWSLIDRSRAGAAGQFEDQAELLEAALLQLEPDEIATFKAIFSDYFTRSGNDDLWAAAYIIGGGCSDDAFMDFRSWLISKGEAVYEATLADPETLVDHVTDDDYDQRCRFEVFAYIPSQAWAKKTGKPWQEMPRLETGVDCRPRLTDSWEEEDLPERLPKLWAWFVTT